MPVSKPKHLYVLYIRTSRKKLWEALTQNRWIQKYFYGFEVKSSYKAGSPIQYLTKQGKKENVQINGKIIKAVPCSLLVHTFSFPGFKDKPTRVTYQLEQMGEVVKLTMTHDQFQSSTTTYKGVGGGWPGILNSLKSLLETGKALNIPMAKK